MKEVEVVDLSQRLSISYYKTVATINEPHHIDLVQHQETGKFYVKKILDVYSINVYKYLKENPVNGIPQIIDFYEENNTLTLIEEYVPGITLREKIDSGKLTEGQIGKYMISLCEILEKLHSHYPPLIHRDIKPSNIMITSFDNVVLLDFNAAKYRSGSANRSSDTVLLGTQGYAAPEQYGFGESSPQTDLYSLGIIMKEACASLPFNNHKFDPIINKCTQMDPSRRYHSAKDLKIALMKLLGNDLSSEAEHISLTSCLPPGFRTMDPGKMIAAIPAYFIIFWICLTLEIKNTSGAALWIERITVLLVFIGAIFIGYNYLDVQRIFPPCRSQNRIIRILGTIGLIAIFAFVSLVVMIFIVGIFFDPTK